MYTALRPLRTSTSRLYLYLHTSAVQQQIQKKGQNGSSRTRLAKSIKPSKNNKVPLEETQRRATFQRARAPHQDSKFLERHHRNLGSPRAPRREEPARLPSFAATEVDTESIRNRKKPLYSFLEAGTHESEFHHPPSPVSLSDKSSSTPTLSKTTPRSSTTFSSPPLLPEFLPALSSMLGSDARPTPIQTLSMKWMMEESAADLSRSKWKQFLLASETGSGKSLAYLLPLLQKLKLDEQSGAYSANSSSTHVLSPRAIILAPTHELSRQLSSFTKALAHHVKLRVLCTSRPLTLGKPDYSATARKLLKQFDEAIAGAEDVGEMDIGNVRHPVDVLVGTPVKIMEMIRGRGWDRLQGELQVDEEGDLPRLRRGRDKMPGVGKWKTKQILDLKNVEWVVVDEADVMFDPDFQEVTRTLLAAISAARGKPIPHNTTDQSTSFSPSFSATPNSTDYPFNFVLTSATIPRNLANYLDHHHPNLVRLSSPRLHHLPRSLKTEYVSWTGGNKFADIERRIREIWSSDAAAHSMVKPGSPPNLSKVLIFCNKNTKVIELAAYLREKDIQCAAVTSAGEERKRGSSKHLEGFLRPVQINPDRSDPASDSPLSSEKRKKMAAGEAALRDPKTTPHVMITTSLLSRGLDFSPELSNVFIVDEPRNMVDFLHRAGRTARAGGKGNIVIFTKTKGRGSARSIEVKNRVKEFIKQ